MNDASAVQTRAPIIVEPAQPSSSVIWLHGLGADGSDFEPVVAQLESKLRDSVRFVFPHAPERAVTINGGMQMPAWYDIRSPDLGESTDAEGIEFSAASLRGLVEAEEARGVPAERIIVAGFSQGGVIALHAGLRHPRRLAGIMALSTYLAVPETLAQQASEANAATPIFLAHGSQDPTIPIGYSERSRIQLNEAGYRVECHTYPMPHSVCAEEIRDISDWLSRVL